MSQIGAVSTMSNRVRSFLAIFSIDGSDPHLMPDLAAAIDITDQTEAAPEVDDRGRDPGVSKARR
jgi:hypothetical protein